MILFSDFDKTLYPHYDNAQFMRNLSAVEEFRQAGNLFGLASGRNLSSLQRAWPEYQQYLDYITLDNGAACFDAKGELLFQNVMVKDLVRQICEDIKSNCIADAAAFIYYDAMKDDLELTCDVTKLRCWVTSPVMADKILQRVEEKYGDAVQAFVDKDARISGVTRIAEAEKYKAFVDIVSAQAGKEKAIEQLSAKVTFDKITTIGDDINDLGMLEKYNGYAVRFATQEVLEKLPPDHVVGSVGELLNELIQKSQASSNPNGSMV